MDLKVVRLKSREEKRILAGHLWVFSNEIDVTATPLKSFKAGELVTIESHSGEKLGIGYINPHVLLAVRLLSRQTHRKIDATFFEERLLHAQALRKPFFSTPFYRLVFSEGDFLSGLVVDRYDDIFVLQLNTAGMENLKSFIIEAIVRCFQPRGIVLKNTSSMRAVEQLNSYVEVVYGEVPPEIELMEHGTRFLLPLLEGQKTGWFFDHRNNREILTHLAKQKRVLDVFCYLGAWGMHALCHEAKQVTFVDSSEYALKYVSKNAELNQIPSEKVNIIKHDAFKALEQLIAQQEKFDIVVLDPPAFIKKRKDMAVGQKAYLQINELALKLLNPGGLLLSASCSMLMSSSELLNTIRKASIRTHRPVVILSQLQQAPDHPVHPAIEETRYLKGFLVSA